MSTDLSSAIAGEPWSLASVVYGVDLLVDDEGRPVSERRAPSAVKQGAPIVLKACPYRDGRRGRPMNVSALEQLVRHLPAVCEQWASFRAIRGTASMDWSWALATVVDQLAAPALYALAQRADRCVVPARAAAGHKLAAGFLGVVRGLMAQEMSGIGTPVTVETLLDWTHRSNALIGTSEVCAGPPVLIQRAATSLLEYDPLVRPCQDAARREIASALTSQVRLGVVWEMFDLGMERAVLEFGVERLRPRNAFVDRSITARSGELSRGPEGVIPNLQPVIPADLANTEAIAAAIANKPSPGEALQQVSLLLKLLQTEEGGALPASNIRLALARHFWHYLTVYRQFLVQLWAHERRFRFRLAYPEQVAMKLHPLILPRPRALHWFEVIWGHRVKVGLQPDFHLTIGNHRRDGTLSSPAVAPQLGSTQLGW